MRLILLLIALTAILWGCDKNRNGQNTPTEKAIFPLLVFVIVSLQYVPTHDLKTIEPPLDP